MTAISEHPPTILGPRPAGLRLKLRKVGESDRVVELKMAKTAVGSDENCHLRLNGSGIDSRHCLILQGSAQTIIRNWSPKTRLNGVPVEDALFSPGDLLNVGNLELEYLSNATDDLFPEVAAAEGNGEGQSLYDALLMPEIETASGRKFAADLAQDALELASMRVELATERTNLESRGDDLILEKSRLLQDRLELQQLLANCQHQATAISTHAAVLNGRESDAQKTDNDLTARRDELSTRRDELAVERASLDSMRDSLAVEKSRLLEEHNELQQLLANCQHQADLVNARAEELVSRERGVLDLGHEFTVHANELAARSEELIAKQDELNARFAELSQQESHLTARAEQLQHRESQLADREQNIERLQCELDEQKTGVGNSQAELTSALTELATRQEDLSRREAEIAHQELALAARASTLAQSVAATYSDSVVIVPVEATNIAEVVNTDVPLNDSASAGTESVADSVTPASAEDAIFDRLRRLSLLKTDSGNSTELPETSQSEENRRFNEPETDPIVEPEPVPEQRRIEQPPMEQRPAHSQNPLSSHHDDDDSVEAYMARLLTRMRTNGGTATETPDKTPAIRRATEMVAERDQMAALRQSIVEPTEATVEASRKYDEEWTLRPRSQAPELTSNLKAMRELANMNTQAALDKHVQKRWSAAALGKAVVAVVAIVSGTYLMSSGDDLNSLEFLSGAAAMIVAIFWGLQSLILTKQVQDVRKKKPEARFENHLSREKKGATGLNPTMATTADSVVDLSAADEVGAISGSNLTVENEAVAT